MIRRPGPRGQNLVLLALTLFLLTLMVTMTLGIASRVRENHELQTVADAAAYSNAVVNARAYNNIAILNRLEVSHWVAMAADESLISYAGWSVGSLAAARDGAATLACPLCCPKQKAQAAKVRNALMSKFNALFNSAAAQATWNTLDDKAAAEALGIQGAIGGLMQETREGVSSDGVTWRLFDERAQQNVGKKIIKLANLPGVKLLEDPGGNDPVRGPNGVSRREIGCQRLDDGQGSPLNKVGTGLCSNFEWNENLLQAAMGSRGNDWVRNRGATAPPAIDAIFQQVAAANNGASFTWGGHTGGGYFSQAQDQSVANVVYAWGDDHGSVTTTISAPPCPSQSATVFVEGYVVSTDLLDTTDKHFFSPRQVADSDPPDVRHTMGTCSPPSVCPAVWIRAVGFQEDAALGEPVNDIHGQPKNVVALQRDYADNAYRRPWELDFKFHFASSGPGTQFDNTGEKLHRIGAGLDISKAIAWATGVSYYHRKGRWDEHPNLLNPFWRATLGPVDVDRNTAAAQMSSTDVTDLALALNVDPGHQWQVNAYKELVVNAGFKGLH